MKMLLVLMTCSVFASVAFADEKMLEGSAVRALLNDKTLTAIENGRAIRQVFQAGGATFTIDDQTQALSRGFWRVEGDKYCSQWPPSEYWACYSVLSDTKNVVFVSADGSRYLMVLPSAN